MLSARGLAVDETSVAERSLKRMWWLECNKNDAADVKRAADRVGDAVGEDLDRSCWLDLKIKKVSS